ncbi:MAG: hypothetical protein ACREFE_04765, partial [Limisphaerales bacterium]
IDFGLSFEQAAPLLAAWNETHCSPRWTETKLNHKLADAFKRTSPKQQFVTGRRETVTPRRAFSPVSTSRAANQNASNRIVARNFSSKCDAVARDFSSRCDAVARDFSSRCDALAKKTGPKEIDTLDAKFHEGTEADLSALIARAFN